MRRPQPKPKPSDPSAAEKTLGQLLYEACAEAFALKGRWDAAGKTLTRARYEAAAKAFVKSLRNPPGHSHG